MAPPSSAALVVLRCDDFGEHRPDRLGISRGSVENYERGARREDGRRIEIPLTVEWACNAVSLDEAAKRQDIGLVSPAWQERIRQLAGLL